MTINCNGFLNVKIMEEHHLYMSDSTIQPFNLETDDWIELYPLLIILFFW